MYDYNSEELNLQVYGDKKPEVLNLANLSAEKVPIVMISGLKDKIVNYSENRIWADKIPSVIEHIELNADHLTFLVGKDISFMEQVIQFIQKKNA